MRARKETTMNTPENNEAMRTALACCTDPTDTLIVEAFFA